jgi:hypothetical protein
MTNREYLRNILTQLGGEVAALRPTPEDSHRLAGDDLYHLQLAINEAAAELERLSADDIEEAYHIKPIYDRLKAVVVGGVGTLAVVGLWLRWFPELLHRETLGAKK